MALEWSAGRKEEASITLPRSIEISCASFWKREDRIGRDNIATSSCSLFTIPWIGSVLTVSALSEQIAGLSLCDLAK